MPYGVLPRPWDEAKPEEVPDGRSVHIGQPNATSLHSFDNPLARH